ncbi:MAG: hypothetical protein Kow0059_05300 [Candidatus Sumerlaeia bacterium]
MSFRIFRPLTAGLLALALCHQAAAQTYTVRNLGVIFSYASSIAEDINNKGVVVGYSSNSSNSFIRGFYIKPPYYQLINIGTYRQMKYSIASSVNNLNVIAGWAQGNSTLEQVPIVSSGNLMTSNLLPAGYTSSVNYDINDNGRIVGTTNDSQAFVYSAGVATTLQPLAGFDHATAKAINNDGVIVGASLNSTTLKLRATRWINNVPSELQVLSDGQSQAFDIADNGTIVGVSRDLNGNDHAFMITPDNLPHDLGVLPGDISSEALGTNGTDAVGDSWNNQDGLRAVLFQAGQVKNLNDLIPSGSGWVLQEARAINIYGQICGVGLYHGNGRAFLLTPNPPTGGAADWDLTVDTQGWTAATNIPPYAQAEAQHVPGTGFGLRATGFPCFAFLQSPEVTLLPGRTYRIYCTVATTAADGDLSPQIRLRSIQTTTNMGNLLVLDSVNGNLPGGGGSRSFQYTLTTQLGAAQTFRFNLDFMFFNPADDMNTWVYLKHVMLWED